jgi:hypothetical protein
MNSYISCSDEQQLKCISQKDSHPRDGGRSRMAQALPDRLRH